MAGEHELLTGENLHEAFHYVQASDPGAVGAGKYWLDTISAPYALKRRNAGDSGWVAIGVVTVDAGDVTFTPSVLADWDYITDPGDVQEALDQLAERITDVESAPGGGVDASAVTYTPLDDNDWDYLTDPGAVDGALDQLALRVNDLEDGGIGGLYASYAKLGEYQTSGTNGGDFASGSYVTRVLNTEVFDPDGIVSLNTSTYQFTLQAGTYVILARAPAYKVARHKLKLYNVSDNADEIVGENAFSAAADAIVTHAVVRGPFTIVDEKIFDIRQRCETTANTFGRGVACSFGDSEVYTVVEIWKLSG